MKKIKLTQGKYAIVDDEDYPYLSKHSWCCSKKREENIGIVSRINWKIVYMDRLIIKAKKGNIVLHINKNELDNRKKNLLITDNSLRNQRAKRIRGKVKTSKYHGVCYVKSINKWRAQIRKGSVSFDKHFDEEKRAAIYYNKKAKELYGKFGYQNKL